jgi:hypothetical protein
MKTDKIKEIIQAITKDLQARHPLLLGAENGTITPGVVALYLHNLAYLFQQTTVYLERARDVSLERSLPELAKFMDDKIPEEKGHDQWAKSDLLHHTSPKNREELMVVSEMERLVVYVRELIDSDPRLFLAYMIFAEYFTVLAGPEFLKNLETKCGIPRSQMTAIANHEEADQHHVIEDLEVIQRFVPDTMESLFVSTLYESGVMVANALTACVLNAPTFSPRAFTENSATL